jgi:glucose-6-phosphate isomerase
MFTKNINFKNFKSKKINKNLIKELNFFLSNNSELFKSLTNKYKYSYNKKLISKFINIPIVRVIGMGGSILGTEAIYDFLSHKVKKKFIFVNNLKKNIKNFVSKYKTLNLIVSKSGNTLETISNVNLLLKSDNKNIFITENNNNYLKKLAEKLKDEIVDHNNFIGGRYSVLSEVGMLPAELMGLNEKKFKQLNNLIKNKNFIKQLLVNVSSILYLNKNKNLNSIILNYDEKSDNLFKWYQQLVAESLGKKSKGILPIISSLPKDNHSTMQLYLDGPKNFFYTFFFVSEKNTTKINNNKILQNYEYLKNKDIDQILYAQKIATEKVFLKKKIPFRSFDIINRNEETLGELFSFFILETILLGRAMKVNPFDQPSVELIKKETKNFLSRG